MGERKRKKERNKNKEKRNTCDGFYQKLWEKEENQKIRLKKNGMKPQRKEKMICRKGCERKTKIKSAQLQEKRREREVKIRKKYCNLLKINTCRLNEWFSMFTPSRLAKHNSMPPRHAPACCKDGVLRSKLNMKNHWDLTFSQMPQRGWCDGFGESCLLINHTNENHLPQVRTKCRVLPSPTLGLRFSSGRP